MNESGFGACLKRDANFNGEFSCFVAQPSACPDITNSHSNPGKKLSAMACEDKNEGKTELFSIERANRSANRHCW